MSTDQFALFQAIGNTPLVHLANINPNSAVKIYAKLEGSNPGGSVKDRPAWYMIKKAIESGELTHNKTILEPTSGNTGIALAMIGASLGFKVKLVMPPCVSIERRSVLEAHGAEVVLSVPGQATDGAIRLAHQIVNESPDQYFMPNQYGNPNNPLAHYKTTGPEIYRQCNGNIDAFVAGVGTSGTLMGTGRALKERDQSIRIIGIEPTLGHTIQGLKNMHEAIVPAIYHEENIDEKIVIEDDEAFDCARELATREGLFVGMSSGAAVAGALRVAATVNKGVIVTLLPDRGDRYLSTTLFRSTCACCPP
ncbi:MAG: cysteine synthase family protein [Thermodesulfobacteriota bacterium]|nr:cysteine synthase family protein [Thermodesulfobacteriota bacterium]